MGVWPCEAAQQTDLIFAPRLSDFELALTGSQQGRLHRKPSASRAPGRRLQTSGNYQLILLSSRGADGDEYLFTLTAFIRGEKGLHYVF